MTTRDDIIKLAAECGIPSVVTDLAPEKFVAFFHAAQKLAREAHKPHCRECAAWVKAEADNREWIEGVAKGKEIIAKLAFAKEQK